MSQQKWLWRRQLNKEERMEVNKIEAELQQIKDRRLILKAKRYAIQNRAARRAKMKAKGTSKKCFT